MKKQFGYLILFACLFTANIFAQQNKIPCATYEAMENYFKNNPGSRERYEASRKQLLENNSENQNSALRPSAVVYTVPTVFHILHTGGAENISDATCINALNLVNNDFARMSQDTASVVQPFKSLYIPSDIKMMLAHKDPSGNCTNGIVHHYTTKTQWDQANTSYYSGITWDPTKYLNIIIVANIIPQGTVTGGGIIVGYTHLPGTVGTGSALDAIVYNYGFLSTSFQNPAARDLTHEIGHWFGLPHTFGNTNNPGVSCGDDGILDTPPTKGAFGNCPSSISGNACAASSTTAYPAGYDNVQNIMNYSGCQRNFTTGQTNVMRNTLGSNVNNRSNVVSSANLIATDVNGSGNCIPIADFISSTIYTVCAGGSLQMNNFSYNGTITGYTWTASNGGIVSNPNNANTPITFPSAGTSNVMLTVGNAQGTNSTTKVVTVIAATPAISSPFFESFETDSIPVGWKVINPNPTSSKWKQTFNAAYDGGASFMIDGSNTGSNQQDMLISPIFDILHSSNQTFSCAIAYAQASSSYTDNLNIEGSVDCGGTWLNLKKLSAATMQVNSGGITTSPYTPVSPQEWTAWQLDQSPYWTAYFTSSPNVMFRFTFTESYPGNGNNIYLDAINLFGPLVNGVNQLTKKYEFTVYPNPTNSNAIVRFVLNEGSNVKINISDVTGRNVYSQSEEKLTSGEHLIPINQDNRLQKGIYIISLEINGTKLLKKLAVN